MTSMPLSTRCIKYLLFIFNLLFVITGIILLSVGASIHGIYGAYSAFLDDGGYMSTSAFLVAIGLIIFIISFFGCCGAVKENFCMTITFTTLLIVIFIFEFAAGISGYVLRGKTKEILEHNLNITMYEYNTSMESTATFDTLQTTFKCCGINSYQDWFTRFDQNITPVSCCSTFGALQNVTCIPGSRNFYNESCIDAFGTFVEDHAVTLGGVALGLAFVQLIGIAFSCHLSKQIKSYQSV